MRWVVTGAGGMLGRDVVDLLRRDEPAARVRALDRRALDVTDAAACAAALAGADVVVNCAAHTAVDAAEADEAGAFAVNALGAGTLARAAARAGARLVHVSTDYVFGGRPGAGGVHRVDDAPAPLSAYGRGKLAGEWAVAAAGGSPLVVRTAWLYGRHGGCFPRTMVRLARERGALRVVDDQIGCPTWTRDVARVVRDLVRAGAPAGTYHAVAAGRASWWEFAAAVLASADLAAVPLEAVPSSAFRTAAHRPASSVLDTSRLAEVGVEAPGHWRARWSRAAAEVLAAQDVGGPVSAPVVPAG